MSVFKGLLLCDSLFFVHRNTSWAAFWRVFPPNSSHEALETLQGCSLRAHSHSGAGRQMFVWFCRMYTLGIRVPWRRKWVTRFEFSSSYSYPVRRQVGRGEKNTRGGWSKEREGGGGRWNDNQWGLSDTWSSLILSFAGTTQRNLS